jgi:hypothetical protein
MNEQELRRLVRDVIARHGAGATGEPARSAGPSVVGHASHAMFRLPVDPQDEGRCVIEPAVMCNHCGFCKSWGH